MPHHACFGPASTRLLVTLLVAPLLAGCGDDPVHAKPAPPPVRAELADDAALATLADWRGLPVLGDGRHLQRGSQDRQNGDPPPVDFVARGNRDMNNFVCRSADADVAEAQVIPFIFDEPSCPEPYVRGAVLARVEGAGSMVRLWMTANSLRGKGVADAEVLRIWVDDVAQPVVDVPLAAAIDGSASEMFAPPFGAGPGDHLAWHYPVVFAKKLVVALDHLGPLDLYYHQVTAVLDPSGKPRHAPDGRLAARDTAKALLSATAQGPVPGAQTLFGPQDIALPAGIETAVATLDGPATATDLSVAFDDQDAQAVAGVSLAVTWDDDPAPAIDAPLGELLMTALASPQNASLAFAGKGSGGKTEVHLRLPMPFTKKARIVAKSAVALQSPITFALRGETSVPQSPFGHLFVERHETQAPAMAPTHPIAHMQGRGRWVGTCMMLEGHGLGDGSLLDDPFNFLEGDERAVLDGAEAIVGTGTEDYFDSAFYFEHGAQATPFAQWWGAEKVGKSGRASACRWHVLGDAVDFQQSAEVDLEIGPGLSDLLERYRSVAFVYR